MTQPPTFDGPVDASWPPPFPDEAVVAPRARGWTALRASLADLSVIVGGLALLGIVSGLLWAQVVEPAQLVRFEESVGQDEVQLQRVFAGDGWYVVIALAAGLLAGVAYGFLRARDLLLTVVLVVTGAVVAAILMRLTGEAFGPSDPTAQLADAAVGSKADAPLVLHALQHPRVPGLGWSLGTWSSYYLAWPLGALLGLMLPLLRKHD